MKRIACVLVALAMLGTPHRAQASVFGEENIALSNLVALQTQQMLDVMALLANVKLVLSGINETAAGVRQAYTIYQTVRKYNMRDFLTEAARGLQEAFPDLHVIGTEMGQLRDNVAAVDNGTFFSHRDNHDPKVRRVLDAAFRHAYRATVWSTVFPDGVHKDAVRRSPVDDLILQRFDRSGMTMRRAMQDTALAAFVQKTTALVDEAEQKDRADLQADALTAQISTQNLNNTTRLRDLAEADAALKELAADESKKFDGAARKAMASHVDVLMQPNWGAR